jgi:hypothetical protein
MTTTKAQRTDVHRSLRLTASLLLALGLAACATNLSRGDDAAVRRQWKDAAEYYKKALHDDPSEETGAKYDKAVARASKEAMAIAKRCESEKDFECVEHEMSWVLEHDATNTAAATLRSGARTAIAAGALDEANRSAAAGKFLEASKALAVVKANSRDAAILAEADKIGATYAEQASALAEERLVTLTPATPARDRLAVAADVVALLEPLARDGAASERLDRARRFVAEADAEIEQARQAAARKKAEDDTLAVGDVSRTVNLVGAFLGPTKTSGKPWDGMSLDSDTGELAKNVSKAMKLAAPELAVAGFLGKQLNWASSAPDVVGTAELFVDGVSRGAIPISISQDSLTPTWEYVQWTMVDLNRARVRITLRDSDLTSDDDIGTVELTPDDLRAASRAGNVHLVRVDGQTSSQILFIKLSAM